MSETSSMTLPAAARHLGVPVRALRTAIRSGVVPAPGKMGATVALPADWLARAKTAIEASPEKLRSALPQKVPAFARYEGTSCWRKYKARVREYYQHRAALAA